MTNPDERLRELQEAARVGERWAAATAELRAAFLQEDAWQPLQLLAELLADLTGAALVAVLRPAEQGAVRLATVRGDDLARQLEGVVLPTFHQVSRQLLATARGGFTQTTIHTFTGDSLTFGTGFTLRVAGPDGSDIGVLLARRLRDRDFTDDEILRSERLISDANDAKELTRARNDRHRLALFEERSRIARDLHDHVIQRLFATGMQLQLVGAQTQDAQVTERLNEQIDALDEAIAEIRTAIFALHDPEDDQTALRDRIVDVVAEYRTLLPAAPRMVFRGPVDHEIGAALASEISAVVRECLSNVVRHARAREVAVRVSVHEGQVIVRVVDDGTGVDPARRRRSGVHNLQVRAGTRGGFFTLTPRPGGGTIAEWRVPLGDQEPDAAQPDAAGPDAAGPDAAGTDAAGTDAVGPDAVGREHP